VLVMRVLKGAPEEGLFRCPLLPLPPLIFLLCSAAGILYSASTRPWPALGGIGILLIPVMLHPWLARNSAR
jgi:hypothetical protein